MKVKSVTLITIFFMIFIINGCSEDEDKKVYRMSLEIAGQGVMDFTQKDGFYTDEYGSNDTWYSEWRGGSEGDDTLFITFPADAITEGITFDESTTDLFEYNDGNGNQYKNDFVNQNEGFTLTVLKWTGPGGSASGTFSGTLVQKEPYDQNGTLEISNGEFEAEIE